MKCPICTANIPPYEPVCPMCGEKPNQEGGAPKMTKIEMTKLLKQEMNCSLNQAVCALRESNFNLEVARKYLCQNNVVAPISGNIGIIVPSSEGEFVGSIPEVPGCLTQGDTVEDCREMLKDALRAWIESIQEDLRDARSPWISVKERLPENGSVLVTDGGRVWVARYTGCGLFYAKGFHDENLYYFNITHWMPIPEPPKDAD